MLRDEMFSTTENDNDFLSFAKIVLLNVLLKLVEVIQKQ